MEIPLAATRPICAFSNGRSVTQAFCQGLTSIPVKNQCGCCASKCTSRWRLCLQCLLAGEIENDSVVIDPESGLCSFHQEHGSEAQRRVVFAHMAVQEKLRRQEDMAAEAAKKSAQRGDELRAKLSGLIATAGEPVDINPDRIRRYEGQPRKYFDTEKLEELAIGIKTVGQLQPAIVRPIEGDPDHEYELVDGERRWRACMLIQRPLRTFVVEIQDEEVQYIVSIASNFAREGHEPMEIAESLHHLTVDFRWSMEEATKIYGRGAAWGYQYIKLTRLHREVRDMLHPERPPNERLRVTVAVQLSAFEHEIQIQLAKRIVTEGLTLDQARQLVNRHMHTGGGRLPGTRRRRPSDDITLFVATIERAHRQIGGFVDFDPDRLRIMLRQISFADLRKIDRTLAGLITNIDTLQKVMEQYPTNS
jgi:ParB family chromosome partitioning protein